MVDRKRKVHFDISYFLTIFFESHVHKLRYYTDTPGQGIWLHVCEIVLRHTDDDIGIPAIIRDSEYF